MNAGRLEDRQSLKLSRLYDAPAEEVFAAWTDPEQVKHWMCPGDSTVALVEMDVRIGGEFRIDMQTEAGRVAHTGVYRVIQPPERLVFTWSSVNTGGRETLVTVELFDRLGQTELVLTHERLPDEVALQAHTAGWVSILEKLAAHLAG